MRTHKREETNGSLTECQFLSGDPWKAYDKRSINARKDDENRSYIKNWILGRILIRIRRSLHSGVELGFSIRRTDGQSELSPVLVCIQKMLFNEYS